MLAVMPSAPPPALIVDVGPLIARQQSPLPVILDAADRLVPGQTLRLLVPFEPVPLYDLLERRGLAHHAEQLPNDTWQIDFRPAREDSATGA